jgi:hypothetical protein
MTRDIRERLTMFARQDIEVRRIALNIHQTAGLPPNFAKESDTRTADYKRNFGTSDCWELDALSPDVIAGLIRAEIEDLVDVGAWDAAMAEEANNRAVLLAVSADVERGLK